PGPSWTAKRLISKIVTILVPSAWLDNSWKKVGNVIVDDGNRWAVPGSMIEHPALVKRLTKAVVEVCIC
ncbi:MAG: hypothetical protein KAS29_03640, partial [Bacteroidales bacterium]|nr:hypothetical protein [Bacteroidales bacterium]